MSAQQTIAEKIKQRRRQMLVHSYIYYEKNTNIISDTKWSEWAKELEKLQKEYPEESKSVEYYEMFKDWDGSSGAFLNFGENIKTVAEILLQSQNINLKVDKKSPVKKKVKKETSAMSLF